MSTKTERWIKKKKIRDKMVKKIPGWKGTSCSLGKTNELQLKKMKHLKFEEDGRFDEEG